MNVFESLDEVHPSVERAVALGLFDGVHRGHQAVIGEALSCRSEGLSPSVFTYRIQHIIPQAKKRFQWIQSEPDKRYELDRMGVETVVEPTFEEFCNLEPQEFAVDFLIKKMRARVICCGRDFHFGKNAVGTVEDLIALTEPYGVEVRVVEPVIYNSRPISSTRIRAGLAIGDVGRVWTMMGRPYSIRFPVVSGNKIGRTLNFPTINQVYPSTFVIPHHGVYVSVTRVDGEYYPSVTNVGVKPTIGIYDPLAETFIIGFSGNLYGKRVEVSLCQFLRREKKFDSLNELREQIRLDTLKAEHLGAEYAKRLKQEQGRR